MRCVRSESLSLEIGVLLSLLRHLIVEPSYILLVVDEQVW